MSPLLIHEVSIATLETLYMVTASGILAALFGIPLGILLMTTRPHAMLGNTFIYQSLSVVMNFFRSIPFIILMIFLIPFTRALVGTSIGTTATIVPLTIGAIPFVARITESALLEISTGIIEAGQAMGASAWQIIVRMMLPEARSNLIKGLTLTTVTLVGYSAMAGVIGGGGLGNLAINYGYQRFEMDVMIITILILVLLVQIIQWAGDKIAKAVKHD